MGFNRSNALPKERLKWTKELHNLFEQAVDQIGGPDRATPKGIVRAMGVPGLTIYHVKSHLQKYRMQIYTLEEDHIGGKFEKKSISEMLPKFSASSAAQLNEALLIQTQTQRRLSDQLEVQKSLKMKIEAQSRFLNEIMEEYKNRTPTAKPVKPYSPVLSLPSLSEESDQCDGKEFDSDSEVDTSQMLSKDESRVQKRIKIQDNNTGLVDSLPSFNPFLQNTSMFLTDVHGMNNSNRNQCAEHEMSFPWSIGALRSSLLPSIYNPLH